MYCRYQIGHNFVTKFKGPHKTQEENTTSFKNDKLGKCKKMMRTQWRNKKK